MSIGSALDGASLETGFSVGRFLLVFVSPLFALVSADGWKREPPLTIDDNFDLISELTRGLGVVVVVVVVLAVVVVGIVVVVLVVVVVGLAVVVRLMVTGLCVVLSADAGRS